jgi:hypothetical protein
MKKSKEAAGGVALSELFFFLKAPKVLFPRINIRRTEVFSTRGATTIRWLGSEACQRFPKLTIR